ncbi:MAG: hypothetical protein OXD32_06745 [Endozoicomonadaceae bacterium]|nr:hypothetical protein [Endozoicomonadaceae bacterium]
MRLKVVDLYDVSHPPKVSSESTKLSAQQENKIIYDVINEPGDGYSDTEETDHNKTYNSKIFQETTV